MSDLREALRFENQNLTIRNVPMFQRLNEFFFDEDAAAATEYAIMLSLLILVVASTVVTLGTKANSTFNNCATKL